MVKYIDSKLVLNKFPLRSENSNKSTFGKILNIAGSKNYIGAAFLSSISALKTGAGYVTLACPDVIIPVIASMAPEITFNSLNSNSSGSISSNNKINELNKYNVISIGCGITTHEETGNFVFDLLNQINKDRKIVIDADGINILAKNKIEISLKNAVITPHPKELSRLLKVPVEEINENREKYARITSQTYECITVLKGHNSIITNGEEIYINKTGSSALAKAGTGDVLTGIISGLLAQKLSLLDAAVIGTYLHGLAGDLAADDLTEYSVLALDVVDYIPLAIKEILLEE